MEPLGSPCPFGCINPEAKPTNTSRATPHSRLQPQHQHLCHSYTSSEKPKTHQGAQWCHISVLKPGLSTREGTEQASHKQEYLHATEQSKGYYLLSR